ncbi:hypothetical protein SZ64_00675 [Erythrobacter sp. SG61-1L]|uniref:hypothetical protein n=1 Tax=Erythrobacter sp. SG61-1L TaxID=1603897 RepID=UPI0006C93233|nr:hypothetical protein [Erythrobacter sp. SG61-1L]KPL66743.1 hypothetical protein SZ64_00675 [Erythrobacter sp. SG61-1L]
MKCAISSFALAAAAIGLHIPAQAQSLDVVSSPIPQAFTNTCQSYSLAFALARAGVPGYELDTVAGVRSAEARVRSAIEGAIQSGETAYSHSVWVRAVSQLTSNNYRLMRRTYSSGEEFMDEVVRKTGISAAGTLGSTLSYLASITPVMTSFTRIGSNNYGGHIVTIFGLDRPSGSNSSVQPKLLLLNSAVKRGGGGNSGANFAPACNSSDLPGDRTYHGALSMEDSYTLKSYGGEFVLFWIEKN